MALKRAEMGLTSMDSKPHEDAGAAAKSKGDKGSGKKGTYSSFRLLHRGTCQ